jgi:ABC-type transport system involved in cytochrome c biogenesis permease subunit
MSAPALPAEPAAELRSRLAKSAVGLSPWTVLDSAMQAIASLKLTVVLFALGIFVVLIGTLAQTQADIWQVVRDYFHAWVMWVDINLFFPESFFPDIPRWSFPLIPAPGGMTIGVLMAVNLLAAHGWRFKIQASGLRLWGGVAVIVLGLAITAAVIASGHNDRGFHAKPSFTWDAFWSAFMALSGVAWLGSWAGLASYGIIPLTKDKAATPVRLVVVGLLVSLLAGIGALLAWGTWGGVRPADEALRIVWQLMQGGLGGLVLLAGCIMVFRKRGGMVLLHAGIGLLMANELLVARQAVEWQIFMQEGQTANYMRDIRTTELAIIDASDPKNDEHIVVPRRLLLDSYKKTRDAAQREAPPVNVVDAKQLLPFQVAVVEYHDNADVRPTRPGEKTPATTGRGLKEALISLSAAKGTDTGGDVDFAGAYVKLTSHDGEDLGTYLISQLASEQKDPARFAERVTVAGKEYQLFLRFAREYLDFTCTLKDVRKDDYVASNTPRNYSSDIQLVDPQTGVDQPVHIKMNDPLRYRSLTFYQSGYNVTADGEATTLQVVRNRIWMIPYVACGIVAIGMLAHFSITLTRFITRRENEELAAGEVVRAELADYDAPAKTASAKRSSGGFNWSLIGFPALAMALFAVVIAYAFKPPKQPESGMDLVRFGRLPVADQGRVKPLDSLAREHLQAISNRQHVWEEYKDKVTGEKKKRKLSAVEWMLAVITGTDHDMEVIRIDHPDLLKIFDLKPRPGHWRYSVNEIRPHVIDRFEPQVAAARKLDPEDLTVDQRKILELDTRLKKYLALSEAFNRPALPELPTEEDFVSDRAAAERKVQAFRLAFFEAAQRLNQLNLPRPIPHEVPAGTPDTEHWQAYPLAAMDAYLKSSIGMEADERTIAFNEMLVAYQKKEAREFNSQLRKYEEQVTVLAPPLWQPQTTLREAGFNHAAPFSNSGVLYIFAFMTALAGLMFRYRPLNWAALTLIALTFLLHSWALYTRMELSGRPPITNLYSSAIAIGWACVLFGMVIELIYRLGLGNIVASVAGFTTVLIAGLLASGGEDTVGVMQAVLDTQFWLATHVVCISLGYAATLLAGLCGMLYLLLGLSTPILDGQLRQILGRIIYGIVCFAILFSFVGTVLGGLWADDSWGRFWGWDPKENGALIIVLWNALVLHARWDKMVGDRGLAVLALGGNIVTAWSWFGVNQLGIGLHSYGFTSGVVRALMTFGIYMLICTAFGALPLSWWWSRKSDTKHAVPPEFSRGLGMAFLAVNAIFLAAFGWYTWQALV